MIFQKGETRGAVALFLGMMGLAIPAAAQTIESRGPQTTEISLPLDSSHWAEDSLTSLETEGDRFGYFISSEETKEVEIANDSIETSDRYRLGQVNNVFQLRDISPDSWEFEALRNLVERYGCIAGYPDGTYRPDRALTRAEFAAGLNACLEQIQNAIARDPNQAEVATLERLLQEFAAELAQLETEVDDLEGRVAFLEDNQFSTTTQLSGLYFVNITGATADGDVRAEGLDAFRAQRDLAGDNVERIIDDDPQVTLSNYIFLTFNTSFNGRDRLTLQLATGDGNSPANQFVSAGLFNTYGVPFTDQQGTPGEEDSFILREAFYQFPVNDNLQFVVGPRINWYRIFDNNAFTFFARGASSFNSSGSTQLNAIDRGAGAAAILDLSDRITLKAAYLGENTEFLPSPPFNTATDPNDGLFDATATGTIEVDFQIGNDANLRLIYNRSNIDANNGFVGGAIAEPLYGFIDDGRGGAIRDATADTFALNFDWRIAQRFGIFGRYSLGIINVFPVDDELDDDEVNAQSIQFGLAFPDLFKEGALGTFSFVVPFDILEGEEFFVSGAGDGGTQLDFEVTYFFPVNSNVALVPAVYVIANPNNFEDNPAIIVGNLRLQFSF